MKTPSSIRVIRVRQSCLGLVFTLSALPCAAAPINKAATGTDLNDGASWAGGVVPGASDIATWDSASLCTGLSQTGTRYWGGISVGSASSDIDISGYGWLEFADGAGIDMSASTKNLTLGTTYFVAIHNSTWTVNEGKTLTVGASPGSVELYYYGGSILTVGGAGNTVLNAYCRTSGYTLTKTGTGTLTTTSQLRNYGGYGGNVNVEGGVLSVQASQLMDGYYSDSGAITVSGGGVLELQNWGYGYDQNLGGLWYDNSAIVINGGTIRMNNTVATGDGRGFTIGSGGATLEANDGNNLWLHTGAAPNNSANGPLTLSGSGNGQIDKSLPGTAATATLTKSGTGTWTLNGSNTYAGATTVSAGTLLVNGSLGGASVDVTGGTLGGSGTIGSATTIGASGTLAPGNSPGDLSFTNTLNLNGALNLEITGIGAGQFDRLLGDGGDVLTLGGILNLNSTGYTPVVGNTITVFSNWSALSGTFATINGTNLGGGITWDTSNLATNGTLTVIPEPAAALLGGLGLLALLRRRR